MNREDVAKMNIKACDEMLEYFINLESKYFSDVKVLPASLIAVASILSKTFHRLDDEEIMNGFFDLVRDCTKAIKNEQEKN